MPHVHNYTVSNYHLGKNGTNHQESGLRTILKNKKFCMDGFQIFFTKDQNPNSLHLQGPKAYFSLFFIRGPKSQHFKI